MPSQHALLSPSSAHRWLHCPPSARECEHIEEVPSSYAVEGTLAHECCERLLLDYNSGVSWMKFKDVGSEMYFHALSYYKSVMSLKSELESIYGEPAILDVEVRLNFGEWIPESFGTSDAVIVCSSELWVIDFKYGKGVQVSAVNNPQLRIYAAGALRKYDIEGKIRKVGMMIIQPRLESQTIDIIDSRDLLAWCDSIKRTANLAYSGAGEHCAGEWCRFCKVKNDCRTRAELNLELARRDFAPARSLSDDEIGMILSKVEQSGLMEWLSDLKTEAINRQLAGRKIQGWKLVKSRGVRQFANSQMTFERLAMSGKISMDDMYEKKPKSPAQIEKLLGKAPFKALIREDEILSSTPKPVLASESDNRPSFEIGIKSALEDFSDTEEISETKSFDLSFLNNH